MTALVQIVDKNDNIITHKPRAEVRPLKDIYRSSCIWIEDAKGNVLLAQRKWNRDKDPGKWGPAASGTVEKGETYETNAYKETEEEIGLTGIELKPNKKLWEENPRLHFIQVFTGLTDKNIEELSIQEDEVEELVWISKEDLTKDLGKNPDKYIPLMPQLVELLIDGS